MKKGLLPLSIHGVLTYLCIAMMNLTNKPLSQLVHKSWWDPQCHIHNLLYKYSYWFRWLYWLSYIQWSLCLDHHSSLLFKSMENSRCSRCKSWKFTVFRCFPVILNITKQHIFLSFIAMIAIIFIDNIIIFIYLDSRELVLSTPLCVSCFT